MKRRNKFGAKNAVYNGTLYHSKKEAAYAAELDLRVKAGELKGWCRQVRVPLDVNGAKVCDYIMDFVAEYPDGHQQWIEVKGYETPEARIKMKFFRARYPERDFLVVR